MNTRTVAILVLPDSFAICRLNSDSPVPTWATAGPFLSITRTADELSIVCPEAAVPEGTRCERDFRCLRIAGTLDFSEVGVLASLVTPLAEAGVSVFAISTFDTDYLLVKDRDLQKAVAVLQRAGHCIES
jgi:hypothetical protein